MEMLIAGIGVGAIGMFFLALMLGWLKSRNDDDFGTYKCLLEECNLNVTSNNWDLLMFIAEEHAVLHHGEHATNHHVYTIGVK